MALPDSMRPQRLPDATEMWNEMDLENRNSSADSDMLYYRRRERQYWFDEMVVYDSYSAKLYHMEIDKNGLLKMDFSEFRFPPYVQDWYQAWLLQVKADEVMLG